VCSRRRLLLAQSSDVLFELGGAVEAFGQHESITSRLRHILGRLPSEIGPQVAGQVPRGGDGPTESPNLFRNPPFFLFKGVPRDPFETIPEGMALKRRLIPELYPDGVSILHELVRLAEKLKDTILSRKASGRFQSSGFTEL